MPSAEEFEAFHRVVWFAIDELRDQAFSGNIARPHHLDSAVECFKDIGVLRMAESIVQEMLEGEDADNQLQQGDDLGI